MEISEDEKKSWLCNYMRLTSTMYFLDLYIIQSIYIILKGKAEVFLIILDN